MALIAVNNQLNVAVSRETRAREQSERRFGLASDAIEAFYTGASEDVLLKEPQLERLRNRLLGSSLEFYKKLQSVLNAEPGAGPRGELARAYERVGEITDRIGSKPAALEATERALELREQLARDRPGEVDALRDLANAQFKVGMLLSESGRSKAALAAFDRARTTRERLVREFPRMLRLQADLAKLHDAIGNVLGYQLGRNHDALREHKLAADLLEALVRDDPNDVDYQCALMTVYQNVGRLHAASSSLSESSSSYERAIAAGEALCRAHPAVARFRSDLAVAHNNVGTVFAGVNQPDRCAKIVPPLARLERRIDPRISDSLTISQSRSPRHIKASAG